jgi:DNA-binding protein YbaB
MNRNMLKQVQQLQAKIQKTQEDLGNETVEGTAGGGAVRVVMTGHQKSNRSRSSRKRSRTSICCKT